LGNMTSPSFSGGRPTSWNAGGGGGGGTSGPAGTSSTGSARPTGASDLRGNDAAEQAFNYFIDKGLTPEQAAGIVGNLQSESGVQPGRNQDGGGPAFGIAQWEGGRRTNLERFAAARGKPVDDLATQ